MDKNNEARKEPEKEQGLKSQRGAFMLQYFLLFVVIFMGLIAMYSFLKQTLSGRSKQAADTFGGSRQYEPYGAHKTQIVDKACMRNCDIGCCIAMNGYTDTAYACCTGQAICKPNPDPDFINRMNICITGCQNTNCRN